MKKINWQRLKVVHHLLAAKMKNPLVDNIVIMQ